MTTMLARLREALGAAGLSALALLAGAALFHAAVLTPLEQRSAAAKQRAMREAPAAQAPGAAGPAGKVSVVYDFLKRAEQPTDWLAKLHAIGAATGVQLKSATYRSPAGEGRIMRYEIVLPLSGSYAQIRDFLQRSSAEIPVMSIDQLTLKRDNRSQAALQGELRLSLHMVKS